MQAIICLLALHAAPPPPGQFPDTTNAIPVPVREVLEKAEALELLSLDLPPPMGADKEKERAKPGAKDRIQGWKMLGSTKVTSQEAKAELLKKIHHGVDIPDKSAQFIMALCFWPRHAIRGKAGGKTAELVICFECYRVRCYLDGEFVKELATWPKPQEHLDGLLKAAKVPLPPKPKEKG